MFFRVPPLAQPVYFYFLVFLSALKAIRPSEKQSRRAKS
jgi:hypothetical protein